MFIVGMAVVLSLFYIGALSFAFIGAEDEPVFKDMLNDLAKNNPGVSLSTLSKRCVPHEVDIMPLC